MHISWLPLEVFSCRLRGSQDHPPMETVNAPPTLARGSRNGVLFGRPPLKRDEVVQKGGAAVAAVSVRMRLASSRLRVSSFAWVGKEITTRTRG